MYEKEIEYLKSLDGDDLCQFCKYEDDCSHGVACHGGEPSYPPCFDGNYEDYIKLNDVAEFLEVEDSVCEKCYHNVKCDKNNIEKENCYEDVWDVTY